MFNEDFKSVVCSIEKKIEVLIGEKKFLESFQLTNDFSLKDWAILRKTTIRGKPDTMLELAKFLIPGADKYVYGPNYIAIEWGDFWVELPTYSGVHLIVHYNGCIYKSKPKIKEKTHNEIFLENMVEMLSRKHTLNEFLKSRFPNVSPLRRYIAYFLYFRNEDKKSHRDLNFYKTSLKETSYNREQYNSSNMKEYNKYIQELNQFKATTIPQLEKLVKNTEFIVNMRDFE